MLRRTALAVAVSAAFSSSALANPSGASIAAGGVSFSVSGNTLTITNTPGAIINWQQFSIQKDEITRFIQQHAASGVLNRVVGQNPSLILGQLSSNGRVFLINPSGIAFGQSAVIDVAGFAASTLNISDADFISGRLRFQGSGAEGKLTNAGTIRTAEGGHVYLIAPNVENEKGAVITSPKGEVVIAAGKTVELVNSRTPDIRVEFTAPQGEAVNAGEIVAASGSIGVYGNLVRNSGRVSASRAEVGDGGKILFKAKQDTLIEAGSRLEATGDKGGQVQLLGERVAILPGARADASGQSGGGEVLVGGDFQGKNPDVQNSKVTYVGSDVEIRVDALASGDGGKAVVWADDTTRFYGTISARGGAQGGNGGTVEVSGKETLVFKGSVDTRAPKGRTGSLLLDPANITIQDGTGDGDDADALNNSFAGGPSGAIGTVLSADTTPTTMFESELEGIAATTNISLQATAAITINNLTSNNLNLAQGAGNSVSFSSATFTMNAGDTITTAGGALNVTTTGAATLGSLATNGGAIALTVGAASSVSGAISGTGTSLTKAGAGPLTLSGANTYTGATNINAGTLTASGGSAIPDASQVTLANVAGAILNLGASETIGNLSGGGATGGNVTLGANALTVSQSGNTTYSGVISGAGGILTKAGTGTLTLGRANTYTGATNVNAGTLAVTANTALGTVAGITTVASGATLDLQGIAYATAEPLTLNGGTLLTSTGISSFAGAVTLGAAGSTVDVSGTQLTLSGVIGGGNDLTKASGGILILSGNNTYTGATNINAGTLAVTVNNALGTNAAGTTVASGATLDVRNINYATTEALTLNGGTLATSTGTSTFAGTVALGATGTALSVAGTLLTVSGVVSGSNDLTKSGAGPLTLSGANTYTGATNINAGTLTASGGSAIPDASQVTLANVAGAILNLGASETIGNLSGGGATGGNVTLGANALTVSQSGNTTYSGVISGAGGILTKAGTGTLTLGRANTYTGATNVNAGTLAVTANTALGTVAGITTVASGATLDLQGIAYATAEPLTLNGGTLLTSTGISSFAGAVTLGAAGSTVDVSGTQLTLSGVIGGGNDLTKASGGILILSGNNTYTGATNINAGTLTANGGVAIPNGSQVNLADVAGAILNLGAAETIGNLSGGGTTGGNVTLGANTLTVTEAGTTTYAGVISGTGGLTKAGAGALTLSGTNTYTGVTTINAGTLTLSGGTAIVDTSQVTLANVAGAVLDLGSSETIGNLSGGGVTGGNVSLNANMLTVNQTGATTYSGVISGSGDLTKTGAATLTLAGANTYTGATNINAGTLTANGGAAIPDGSQVNLANVAGAILTLGASETIGNLFGGGTTGGNVTLGANTLTVNEAGTTSYAGAISGTGGLTKAGAGTLTLTGTSTYTGATNVNAGTLSLNSGTAIADTSAVTLANVAGATLDIATAETIGNLSGGGGTGGNITLGAALTVNQAGTTTYSGAISGTGGLTKANAAGTLILSGASTYSGATSVNAGTLAVTVDGALGSNAGGTTVAAGATLDLRNVTYATAETITLNGGTLATSTGTSSFAGGVVLGAASPVSVAGTQLTLSGGISGTGPLTKSGAGILDLSTTASTYTGATTVSAGTLRLQSADMLPDTTALTVTGTFNLNGFNETVGSIAGAGGIALGAATLTSGGDGTSTTHSGVISGAGNLTKAGTGTLTLNAINTYTGITTVNGGTLSIGADNRLGAAPGAATPGDLVLDGGTLQTTATFTLNANRGITLGPGGGTLTQTAGTLTYAGIAAGSGDLTKAGAGALTLAGANTYTGATNINAGTLTANGGAAIPDGSQVNLANVAGAILTLGASETIGNLSGGGTTGGNVTLGANTLTVNEAGTTSYAGAISGTGGLTKAGAGTLTLTGTSTYTGATNVNAGTLSLNSGTAIADTSAVTLANVAGATLDIATAETIGNLSGGGGTGGNITLGASLTVNQAGTTTYSGAISGTGGLTKANAAGTLILSGASTYSGATSVNAGTLAVTVDGALGSNAGGTTVAAGATLDLRNVTYATAETVTLNGGTLATSTGTSSFAGGVVLGAASPVSVAGTQLTLSGGISGTGPLTKSGAGILDLSTTASTYTGATTVSAGTLRLQSADMLPDTTALTVTGAFNLNGFNETVGSIAGAGGIALGAATLTSGGDNTSTTHSGVISGTGNLTKTGTGTLTLNAINTYTGITTVNAGTLSIGADNRLGAAPGAATPGDLVLDGGTLQTTATFTLNANRGITLGPGGGTLTQTAGTLTYAGIAAGSGDLTKAGAGALTLAGANTYTGATNINAGTLTANGGAAIPDGSQVNLANVAGAILTLGASETIGNLSGGGTTGGNVTLGANTLTVNEAGTTSYAGAISGTGGLTKAGAGTLTLSGTSTYTGATNVNAGTLAVTVDNALGGAGTGTTVAASATLDLQNVAYAAAEALTLNGTLLTSTGTSSYAGTVALGATSAVDVTGIQLSLSGVVSGANALTKTGAGILVLSGNNTFSGATGINAGTLVAGNANALGSTLSGTTVADGAALQIANVPIGNEALTLNGTGISGAGALTATGTAQLGGAVTLATDSSIRVAGGNLLTLSGTVQGAGALDVGGGGLVILGGAVGNTTALASFTSDATTSLFVNGGSLTTSGNQSYGGATTFGVATTLTATAGSISAGGAITATSGLLTVNASGDATFSNTANNFSTVQVAAGGNVSLVDANAMTLGASSAGTLFARTLTGDLTLGGNVSASGAGDSIVLVAGANFLNSASRTLSPGAGRWLVYSTTPTADTPGVTPNFKHYGISYAGAAYGGPGTGNGLIYSTAAAVDASLTGLTSKTYDGTMSASLAPANYTVTGAFAGDMVLLDNPALGTYADKNVGTGKSVSTTVSITGVSAGGGTITVYGYMLNSATASGNIGDIAARALTVTASGTNKVYDGATAATVTLGDNRVAGDVLTASYTTADFNNKNVGTAKPVSVAGIGISGTDSGNYTFNATAATSADITARALTVTASGTNKVYDGATAATVTLGDNRVAGDVLTTSYATADFNNKNVGTAKPVSVAGIGISGTDSGNYTFNATAATSADITARALTVTASGTNKVYDGATAATVTLGDNRVAGDVLTSTYTTADFNNKNVGTAKPVSVAGIGISGTDSGNYTFNATAATSADITARALTVTAAGTNKVYDGATTATVTLGDNRVAGDVLTSTYTTADFNNKNVGTAKPVSVAGIGISGTDSGNYTFNATASTSADITARALTVTASGTNKVYDGATTATVTLGDNRVVGDVLTTSYTTADFNNKNVGAAKPVSVSGIGLSGTDSGNYTFNATAGTSADITARALTVTATGTNKVYDGATTATVTLGDNRVVGDVLTTSYTTADFNNKNVGTAKPVSVSGIGLSGTDSGNYTFNATASTSADITARALTVTAAGTNKVYDGVTTATVTLGDNRVAGDVLTSTYTTADFNNKNVGTAKPVSVSGIGISGTDSGNYTFNATAATSADITARALTVTASGTNKVYDGATAATVTLGDNRVAGDVLTSTYTTADFNNKNVGTAKPVSVAGIGISGTDSGNYTFNATAATSADIAARALTVTASGTNKVYDGATAATVTLGDNRVAGDVLTASYTTADFNNKNVGTAKPVSVAGIGISGTDSGNYTFNATAATSADITARALTVTASGTNKVYDGATAATVTLGDNRVAGDVLTTSYATADFNNKNVGTAKPVSVAGIGISGTDSGNYTFNATAATSADITARALTVTASGTNKVYDGATAATVTLGDNRVAGDVLTSTYTTADFNNKNVGTAKPVSVAGIGISGTDSGNYTFNATAATSADITARALTVTAAGTNKVYDGATTATVTLGDNRVAGDVLTSTYTTADFNNKNVGTAKPVSVAGIGISGTDSGNYTFNATAATSADITARALTITAQTNTKTYDATTGSAAVPTVSGVQAGDSVTGLAQVYADKNAGSGKTLNVSAYTVNDGNLGGNYTVSAVSNTTGVINQAALTLAAQPNTKTYDATTGSATLPAVAGLQGADTVTGLAQTYANKDVGTGKALAVSSYTVNDGFGGGNYAISLVGSAAGVINPAPLSIKTNDASRPVAQTNPPFSATYSGLQGGESPASLTGSLLFATIADPSSPAGNYPVTPSGVSSPNYSIMFIPGTLQVVGTTTLIPDPLATVVGTLQSPMRASGGGLAVPVGSGIYALGNDEDSRAQFLNGLPPTAAGQGDESAVLPVNACGSVTPFSVLRCGQPGDPR